MILGAAFITFFVHLVECIIYSAEDRVVGVSTDRLKRSKTVESIFSYRCYCLGNIQ